MAGRDCFLVTRLSRLMKQLELPTEVMEVWHTKGGLAMEGKVQPTTSRKKGLRSMKRFG